MEGQIVFMSPVPPSGEGHPFDNVREVLKKSEVADLLGVNVRTVSREIQRGRLGCIRVGTCVRVTKEQLLRYIEEAAKNV